VTDLITAGTCTVRGARSCSLTRVRVTCTVAANSLRTDVVVEVSDCPGTWEDHFELYSVVNTNSQTKEAVVTSAFCLKRGHRSVDMGYLQTTKGKMTNDGKLCELFSFERRFD
jgi:hypothetical protein